MVAGIAKKAAKACPNNVSHGFMLGKSPVTNAKAHIGHEYTLSFDLTDFFDTVNEAHLKGKLSEEELKLVFVDGAPRQGLPTSPPVANLAASDMDKAILKWRDKNKFQFIYTRYADDLTFSYDDVTLTEVLKKEIPIIVKRCNFKLNESKTKFQSNKGGYRIITGIAVGDELRPTRYIRRKLRAAIHQNNYFCAQGLQEWMKLKEPKEKNSRKLCDDELNALCLLWRLPKINLSKVPEKVEEDVGDNCIITGDIAYTLGCSTFTTGWVSCLSQPNGQYRKTAVFWVYMRGTRVAALLSDKTKIFGKTERRIMKARALVHELRNGQKVFDRLYGSESDKKELMNKLTSLGYEDIKTVPRNLDVVGHSPASYSCYFDNLKSRLSTASQGPWKGRKVRVLHT